MSKMEGNKWMLPIVYRSAYKMGSFFEPINYIKP